MSLGKYQSRRPAKLSGSIALAVVGAQASVCLQHAAAQTGVTLKPGMNLSAKPGQVLGITTKTTVALMAPAHYERGVEKCLGKDGFAHVAEPDGDGVNAEDRATVGQLIAGQSIASRFQTHLQG